MPNWILAMAIGRFIPAKVSLGYSVGGVLFSALGMLAHQ